MHGIYQEYAVLEAEIAALEAKKAQLRPFILERMNEEGLEKLDTGFGTFIIANIKKWTYPKSVVELENELKSEIETLSDSIKEAQEKAKSTGEATCEVSGSLRFTPLKL